MSRVDDHMKKNLEKHYLYQWKGGDDLRGFLMRAEGTMNMSVSIIAYPHGVAIMGDIAPGRGCCIERKDLEWFAGNLSESYLLEKSSIPKEWQADAAAEYFEDFVGTLPDLGAEEKEEWEAIIRKLKAGEMDAHELASDLETVSFPLDDGLPGLDYKRSDAAWLCAIQQRFAKLYGEMVKK